MIDEDDEKEAISELEGKIVYKPCKNCKAVNYDNADEPKPTFTKDGLIVFEPKTCDQCNFELVIPESGYHH